MPVNELPRRRSVRLFGFDYGSDGSYFITVCSHEHHSIFGTIRNGIMCLNELGAQVWHQWLVTFEKRPAFSAGSFVVMPNHWHGIIHITRTPDDAWNASRIEQFGRSQTDTIATMIKGMKSAVTSFALSHMQWQGKLWQRGMYDHVIRNPEDYQRIDQYILNNISTWGDDRFYR